MISLARPIAFLLVGLAVGCGPTAASTPVVAADPPPAAADARPTPPSPGLRLPSVARPLRYAVDLTLDPAKEDFTGAVGIDLEVLTATDVLWLHGEELTVAEATLTVGTRVLSVDVRPVGKDFLALLLPASVPAGPARLDIAYAGKAHADDGDGVYRAREGEDHYIYTQFEATDARSAFPCFDEPAYKVPWQLTIHTRKELSALANTPALGESEEPGGMKAVRFAESKPMPSYLVAFAVGPFDFVDAGTSRSGVPIRIVVPRGRAGDAAHAAENTAPLLAVIEDYFGSPYPYEKLDFIACLVFNAGAMENPGLVTFRHEILLTKPGELTLAKQVRFATVAAHEIAHQWFGNYVTLAFWDDIWLNESFATWVEEKAIKSFRPAWGSDVGIVASRSAIMDRDALDTARAIRQPIKIAADIEGSFDGITYAKGLAVLHMLETWLGEDVFQKGVRLYMQKHAWGNATYEDFLAALTEAAGRDVRGPLDTFVLQSGAPILAASLRCEKDGAKLSLAQRRYKPIGSQIKDERTWKMPICVKWSAGGKQGRDCTVLGEAEGELDLTAPRCPDWVLPNASYVGYYRSQLGGDLLERLKKHAAQLSRAERVGLLGDVDALVKSGDMPQGTAMALVDQLARDEDPHVVGASLGVVEALDEYVPDELRPNYERYVRRLYGKTARKIGWKVAAGEPAEVTELRPRLLALVAVQGNDPALAREAVALTEKWLADGKSVDPELVGAALGIAVKRGDAALYDTLLARAKAANERQERDRYLRALGGFSAPALVERTFALMLSDTFELRDSLGLLRGPLADPRARKSAMAAYLANFDAIMAKLPGPYRRYVAMAFAGVCDESQRAEIEAKYRPKVEALDGGKKAFDQAMEGLSLCAAQKAAQTPAVVAFLKKQ